MVANHVKPWYTLTTKEKIEELERLLTQPAMRHVTQEILFAAIMVERDKKVRAFFKRFLDKIVRLAAQSSASA